MEMYPYNPSLITRDAIAHLKIVKDIDIVDATNPFVYALEMSSVTAAAAMAKCEANTRRQYEVAALSPDDLYPHMSDVDYIGRFATPSKATFGLFFSKEELLAKLVLDETTGVKKLVIPRNTFFTVADTKFSLQYPIEIRQLIHGGLQIVYINDQPSPLQSLSTNIIDPFERPDVNGTWLYFTVDTQQFEIISMLGDADLATGFRGTYTLSDQYYYCRVYSQNADGGWSELKTTHAEQVYDITVPTAVLKLSGITLTVTIPQIYSTMQMVRKKIRVDVYQTKGVLDLDLGSNLPSAFVATWLAINEADDNKYTAPLRKFQAMGVTSDSRTAGGVDMMTFDTLRKQVIRNAVGDPNLPITNIQIETALENQGYDLVKNIDHVTNRVILATKPLPTPSNEKLITAAAASVETLTLSINDALVLNTVIDNGDRVTFTPETLYQRGGGILKLVPTSQVNGLLALPPEKRAIAVTNGNYYYSCFHYVLDNTGVEFELRPYFLDKPTTVTKVFIRDNDTTNIDVGTDGFMITKNDTTVKGSMGYTLRISTKSGDSFKVIPDDQIYVQLAYVPVGENTRAYLNGKYVGRTADTNERIFDFDLGTYFDVDAAHSLQMNKFKMFNKDPRLTGAMLTQDFDIIYITSSVMDVGWKPKAIDKILGNFLLPARVYGIANERITLRFGDSLKMLWARARSIVSTLGYKRHDTDQVRTYKADIYKRDPQTNSEITFDASGNVVMTLLHGRGTPVLDVQGNLVYDWRTGDVVLDNAGNPVVADERGMLRQLDIFLIEGAYRFATDSIATDYRAEMVDTLVAWLINDLTAIDRVLLEQTRLYFYPKATMGQIDVMANGNNTYNIASGQSFVVNLTVPEYVFKNAALKAQLTINTVKIISQMVQQETVAMTAIESAQMASYGTDVINAETSGLGGVLNLRALTVVDSTKRLSIRKRLTPQQDASLIAEEDVTVIFTKLKAKD